MGSLKQELVTNRRIYLPAGKAKFTLVDTEDIGAVTAAILDQPENHFFKSYELTSQDLLSFEEMAAIISEETGKKISYHSPNLLQFFLRMKKQGVPAGMIFVMIMLHYLPRFQSAPVCTTTIQELTGHEPKSFRLFAREVLRNLL